MLEQVKQVEQDHAMASTKTWRSLYQESVGTVPAGLRRKRDSRNGSAAEIGGGLETEP
jgi:hypothetical protein